MYSRNIIIFALILSIICANAVAKRRTKTKFKQANIPIGSPFSLTGCGCQNPLFNILDCGCHSPVLDTPYTVVSYEAPACGCQVDVPNYRYVDTIEIVSPLEVGNYGCLGLPSVEYVTPYDMPCGCQGSKCGCRASAIKLPTYGTVGMLEVPSCGCQELKYPGCGLGNVASIIEIPALAPAIQVPGCSCLGSCGCQTLSCGCPGPVCGCQNLSCGCSGPVCGCQTLSCGCPGPVCGCQSIMPCGCVGAVCGCQSPLPCGCQGPTCGCQTYEMSPCGIPGCTCDGNFLRQVTLQPPFL